MKWLAGKLFLGLVFAGAIHADLGKVRAEDKLEKRAELAAENALEALEAARAAWKEGKTQEFEGLLDEVLQSVNLSLDSLQETGKPAYKLTKSYKKCEIRTRELGRYLSDFAEQASLDDRSLIDKVNDRVQIVHEELLLGAMSRKK